MQTPDDSPTPQDGAPEDEAWVASRRAQAPSPAPQPLPPGAVVRCLGCGYDLTGSTVGGQCPECGQPVNESFGAVLTSGHAIACMVLGIVSLVFSAGCFCGGPLLAAPCGVAGLVLYRIARQRIREGGVSPSSSAMNTAGLVCSIIGLVGSVLMLGFFAISMLNL